MARIRSLIQATGIVAVGLTIGLLTVQGTYAMWNIVVPAHPGTVHSANFTVLLSGSGTTASYPMTTADGSPATVSLTTASAPLGNLYPGEAVHSGLKISNATNATSDLAVRAVIAGPAAVTAAGSDLGSYLVVEAAVPPPGGGINDCAAATGYSRLNSVPAIDIPHGGDGMLCFRIQLALNAPADLQNQTASVAIPLRVDQL